MIRISFLIGGINEKRTHSKGVNFRVMVNEAIAIARSSITDQNFGFSLLPGANPEWTNGKTSVENELGVTPATY